jgi:hypothetical protein
LGLFLKTTSVIGTGIVDPTPGVGRLVAYMTRAIRSRVCDILDAFKEVRPKLYNDCAVFYDRQRNGAVMHEAIRKRKWAILTEKANQRSESLRRTGS